jgi:hypothetical protein
MFMSYKPKLLCEWFGCNKSGKASKIHGRPGMTETYFADICPRCGKRNPVSSDDAEKKQHNKVFLTQMMGYEWSE